MRPTTCALALAFWTVLRKFLGTSSGYGPLTEWVSPRYARGADGFGQNARCFRHFSALRSGHRPAVARAMTRAHIAWQRLADNAALLPGVRSSSARRCLSDSALTSRCRRCCGIWSPAISATRSPDRNVRCDTGIRGRRRREQKPSEEAACKRPGAGCASCGMSAIGGTFRPCTRKVERSAFGGQPDPFRSASDCCS
jgi:hypothetical protein